MSMELSAPRQITWFVCLGLYAVALLAHFGGDGNPGRRCRVVVDPGFWSLVDRCTIPQTVSSRARLKGRSLCMSIEPINC